MLRHAQLTCALFCMCFTTTTLAEDWTQFRGPTGQGTSELRDLPASWSSADNVAWKQELPGTGWSSPIVYQDRIYLTTAIDDSSTEEASHSLHVLCLEAKSGKTIWDSTVFTPDEETSPNIHNKNSHASPTPVIVDERIYAHFGHQGIACLDLQGNIIWRNRGFVYPPVHGNGGSPVIVGDAVIFSCDGAEDPFVIALRRSDGYELWRTPRPVDAVKKFSFSTPLVIDVDGRKQVICPGSDIVSALDVTTGEEIWHVKYDGYSVVPRPVFHNGLLFVCTGFGKPDLLAIRPDGRGDVTDTHVEWTVSKGAPNTPSPVVVGNELFMVSDRGVASCVDVNSGELVWQERLGGGFSASPVYADGKIYFQNEAGEGTVIEASREFKLLATNPLDEQTLASYALTDRAILLRTEKHLYRIEQLEASTD